MVKVGSRREKRGMTLSLSKTCPIFNLASLSVMTAPAFISEPVPAMVRTQPTGTISQEGSSKRR